MNLKLPKTYKLVLALAVVAGPFTWLMFTEDGQRRSDLFLLHLTGHRAFNIGLDRLDARATMADVETQFPRLSFACRDAATNLGDRLCAAEIGSFNGIPARAARLWSADGQVRALQLDYRRRYHALLVQSLSDSFGAPVEQAGSGQSVYAWALPGGMLMLPARVEQDQDAALMWLAGQR